MKPFIFVKIITTAQITKNSKEIIVRDFELTERFGSFF